MIFFFPLSWFALPTSPSARRPSLLKIQVCTYPHGISNGVEFFPEIPNESALELKTRIANSLNLPASTIRLHYFDGDCQWQWRLLNENQRLSDLHLLDASESKRFLVEVRHAFSREYLMVPGDESGENVLCDLLVDLIRFRRPKGIHERCEKLGSSKLFKKPALLLNFGYHAFDLDLTHDLSKHSWNLPSELVESFGCSAEKLKSFVKTTDLSLAEIESFLDYICLCRPSSKDSTALFLTYHRIVAVFNRLGLDASTPLLDLGRHRLTYKDAAHGLIGLWLAISSKGVHHPKHDHVVGMVIPRLLPFNDHLWAPIANRFRTQLISENRANDSWKVVELSQFLVTDFSMSSPLGDCKPPLQVEEIVALPIELSNAHPAALLPHSRSNFYFIIVNGEKEEVICDSLVLLLTKWQWIADKFNAREPEALSCMLHLPSGMTRKALLAILHALRGELLDHLDSKDALAILEHGSELGLCLSGIGTLTQFSDLFSLAYDARFKTTDDLGISDAKIAEGREKRTEHHPAQSNVDTQPNQPTQSTQPIHAPPSSL